VEKRTMEQMWFYQSDGYIHVSQE